MPTTWNVSLDSGLIKSASLSQDSHIQLKVYTEFLLNVPKMAYPETGTVQHYNRFLKDPRQRGPEIFTCSYKYHALW